MELVRSVWLAMLIPAIMVSFPFYGEAAATDGQAATAGGPLPETNVLCVSKCGTCPMVCSSPSLPPPNSDGSGYSSLSPPGSTTSPPSPPAGQPQAKGGEPSGYYYFFTAGSGPSCAASSFRYALMLLALLPLVAV